MEKAAVTVAEGIEDYDFLLVNDEIDECVDRMHGLIQAMHARVGNHLNLIRTIREEMKDF